MRMLKRNGKPIYYAHRLQDEAVYVDGLYTGETAETYSAPIEVMANIAPASGAVMRQPFGLSSEYDTVVMIEKGHKIAPDTVFWLDKSPTDAPHDHVVYRVSESLNTLAVALRRVNVRG